MLPVKRIRPRRYRPGGVGNWSGHLPFIHDLVEALRPSRYVELGTHYGESYFGVCQAVEENNILCECFAVDTWRGDEQTGFYDESVFEDVDRYNAENYRTFSSLVRTTFDQALGQFEAESIDLLHIDGLHTYDAVKHDFECWLPKVRPGGIVLLHDVEARHGAFGVWKLWQEVACEFRHFVFPHSWGLGLVRKPGNESNDSRFVKQLCASSPEIADFIRHYYLLEAEVMHISLQPETGEPATTVDPSAVLPGTHSRDAMARECEGLKAERDQVKAERDQLKAELTATCEDLHSLRLEVVAQTSELRRLREQTEVLAGDLDCLRLQIEAEEKKRLELEQSLFTKVDEADWLNKALIRETAGRADLLNSYSWKASAPFRRLADLLRPAGTKHR